MVNSSHELRRAQSNWIGVELEGAAGVRRQHRASCSTRTPTERRSAGRAATERNVFADNATEGLDIEGADNADVHGNYFGVKPDGSTPAANGKNIEITDTVAFTATGNEVGGTITGPAAPCDGACNVISGASFAGIDLLGNGGNEEAATGPTTIHGNYVGLSAAGTAVVANASYGLFAAGAGEVTLGGPRTGTPTSSPAAGRASSFQRGRLQSARQHHRFRADRRRRHSAGSGDVHLRTWTTPIRWSSPGT